MQLMPGTAKWLAHKINISISSENNGLYDPDLNVSLGTQYLKMLLREYSDKEYLALASYNAGTGNVKKWLRDLHGYKKDEFIELIPFDETQQFVKNVLRNRAIFKKYKIFEN